MSTAVFDFGALHAAWRQCRKGKAAIASSRAFEVDLERQLLALSSELMNRTYQPYPSVCFVTEQPKRREIFAAAFRDRVVHHLVVRHLEPYWEPRFIHDSYACRRGKGTQAAVDRIQRFMRQVSSNGSKRAFVMHLDVRSFFVRIDKQILFDMLDEGLRRQAAPWQEDMRWLIRRIVFRDPAVDAHRIGSGFETVPEHKSLFHTGNVCGLPIGNYTSQFFANVYLDKLDQFVKHVLKARYYLRYVDDLILMAESREQLELWERAIHDFLVARLRLELNHKRRYLAPVSSGVDALGYVVHLHHRLLRRRTVRRFAHALDQARRSLVRSGVRLRVRGQRQDFNDLLARCMSYRGLLRHANSTRLMMHLQMRHAWIGDLWHLTPAGKVRRHFQLSVLPADLATQWRLFKRMWSGAHVLMRIGSYWEAFGGDALWLREQLDLQAGRRRPGLGEGAGFHCHDLARRQRLAKCAPDRLIWLGQSGCFAGRVEERVVVFVMRRNDAPPLHVSWLIAPRAASHHP